VIAGNHAESAMSGIAEWLASIGLEEYAQRFTENAIDLSTVRDLTEQDLKELGVLLGHRRKMLRAIAELAGTGLAKSPMAAAPSPKDDAGRRQLTVMFCDLVGSTALSARLDPEDLRAVIGAYHACIAEVIDRYGGNIARYMGDGVLAYFGYPQAHEDDAEQATHAGLALVEGGGQSPVGQAADSRRHRHGNGDRRRSARRGRGPRAGGRRRDAESCGAPASVRRAGRSADIREYA
jgi:hypothetical protein